MAKKKSGLPNYKLDKIALLRKRLAMVGGEFIGQPLDKESFQKLIALVSVALPEIVSTDVLRETMSELPGEVFTLAKWKQTVWRIAGNQHALVAGCARPVWSSQPTPEWMPMELIEATKFRRKFDGQTAIKMKFVVLAGSACSQIVQKIWSLKAARYMRMEFGFSRFNKPTKVIIGRGNKKRFVNFPYHDPMELVRLRVWGLFDTESCLKGRPEFSKLKGSSNLIKHNRKILLARYKLDPPCPISANFPCWNCPVGYEKCGAACHPRTWQKTECKVCKNLAWCDPGGTAPGVCQTCIYKGTVHVE